MGFINGLPRGILVVLVLVGGLILVVAANPPHTACDSQLEIFMETQKTRLFAQDIKGIREAPRIIALEKACKETNSSGGCYELFLALHKMADVAEDVPVECADKLMAIDEFKAALNRNLSLLVRLAWGDKAPESTYDRNGWLESPDLVLYCQLVHLKSKYGGKEEWDQLRDQLLTQLPGAAQLETKEAWSRSVLSTDCRTLL